MASKLIVTSAVNYTPEGIRVLLRSVARHIPDSAFLVFHERTDEAFRDELQKDHPEVHLVRPADLQLRARRWKGERRRRELRNSSPFVAARRRLMLGTPWKSYGTSALHIVMARYFWIKDAMSHPVARRARYIMVCDSRDVCAQADPFESLPGELVVGAWGVPFERRSMAVNWLRERFPENIANRVVPQPNLSNGIILGTRERVQHFLNAFTQMIMDLKPHPFGQTGDQKLINVLLHGYDHVPFTITHTGEGLMAHLIQTPWENLQIDDEGLKTRAGETVRLLHHYEFHPELVEIIRREYESEAGVRPKFHPVRPPPKHPVPLDDPA